MEEIEMAVDQAEPGSAVAASEDQQPESTGRYAIYRTPDGGYQLVYREDGSDTNQGMSFPAVAVRIASQISATGKMPNPAQLMKVITTMMRGA